MTEFLCDLSQDVCGNIVLRTLGVDGEEYHRTLLEPHRVDDADATAFAGAWPGPSDLATAAGARDYVACFRI